MSQPEGIESSYYEHRGFSSENFHHVRSHYLKFVEGRDLLIELGCGRGEFLLDAKESVKRVLGVDIDPGMVSATRSLGLHAVEQDAFDYLRTTSEKPDAIFAAHLVEHFSVERSLELIGLAKECLVPGGVLVLVTPNPQSLSIILNDFWSDPTHERPYNLPLLRFMIKHRGMDLLEAGLNPKDDPGPPPDLLVPDTLLPWSELEPPALTAFPAELLQLEEHEIGEKLALLLRRIYEINHALFTQIKMLDARVDQVRHQATAASFGVNKVLEHLYGPNEIFVVGLAP